MPWYRCHKKVQAFKIGRVELRGLAVAKRSDVFEPYTPTTPVENSEFRIIPEDDRLLAVCVPFEWERKHRPTPGDWFVVYEDGYCSVSPPEAFESGYTLIDETVVPDEDGSLV